MRRKFLAALAADGKRGAETGIAPPERVSSTYQLSIDSGPAEDAWDPAAIGIISFF